MSIHNNRLLADEGAQRFMPDFIATDSQAAQRFMAQYHVETGYPQTRKDSGGIERWTIVVDVSEDGSGPCLTFSSPDGDTTFSVRPGQNELYLALESFALLPQRGNNGALVGVDWADLVLNSGSEPWQFRHFQANDVQELKECLAAFTAGSDVRFAVMLLLLPGEDVFAHVAEITAPLPAEVPFVFQLRTLEEISPVSGLSQICLFWRI